MPQLPPKPPTEFEKVSLAQVQGQNEREVIKTNVELKRIEAEMRAKLLDYELQIKELELKYNTKINEIDLKNRSMIESQKLATTSDIFKKIMEGQKRVFLIMDNKIPQSNLDQQILRGKQASILLEEPLLKEAFEYLSESYRSEIFKTHIPTTNKDKSLDGI